MSACSNLYLSHPWHNGVISSWIQIVAGIQVTLFTSIINDKIITLCTMQQKRQYVHVVTQARRQTHVNPCKGIRQIFPCGICSPTNDWIPESNVPLTNTGNQYWESGIRSAESEARNPESKTVLDFLTWGETQTPFIVKTA